MNKEIIIKRADELHKIFSKYRKSGMYKFRGQSNIDWSLIPKAGREKYLNIRDVELFRHWKRRALNYIEHNNLFSNWDYLAIAQHNGLPTRLLDWSHNPLIATFFACNENSDMDGVVYIVKPYRFYIDVEIEDPFDTDEDSIIFFQPSSSSLRVANQYGYFSIHNFPDFELSEDDSLIKLERIVIPQSIKSEVIHMLNQYGINYLTIYPDLEGLSKHLSWFSENYKYWDGTLLDDPIID